MNPRLDYNDDYTTTSYERARYWNRKGGRYDKATLLYSIEDMGFKQTLYLDSVPGFYPSKLKGIFALCPSHEQLSS